MQNEELLNLLPSTKYYNDEETDKDKMRNAYQIRIGNTEVKIPL
jgi:hypothetical protein